MQILVIEPYSDGHRAVYAARIVRGALDRGHKVVLVTLPGSIEHSEYQQLRQDNLEHLSFACVSIRGQQWLEKGGVLSELTHWLLFRKMMKEGQKKLHDIGAVFVCYLDYCLHMIAVLGSPFGTTPFSGVVMKVKFHHQQVGINTPKFRANPVKEKLFERLLAIRTLWSVYSIDETLVSWGHERWCKGRLKLVYVPDPADMLFKKDSLAGLMFKRGQEVCARGAVILVYGWLNERKGIQYLIPAVLDLLGQGVRLSVLLVGRQDDFVRRLLSVPVVQRLKEGGSIQVLDRFVTPEEEYDVFEYSDIVWLGYKDFYVMSGVMVQAGKMGLPVVVTDKGLTSWMTRKYKTGLEMKLSDKKSISSAVYRLVSDTKLRKSLGANAIFAYREHTLKNFLDTIFERLEKNAAQEN